MFKNLIPWKKDSPSETADIDPINELAQFRANFDRILGEFWGGDSNEQWNNNWGFDMKDSEDAIVVRAEAPGFEPDEIDVQLSGNRLVVQAEHKEESENGNGHLSHRKVYRSVTMPAGIEADKIEATYKNGVLEVHLPKGEEAAREKNYGRGYVANRIHVQNAIRLLASATTRPLLVLN